MTYCDSVVSGCNQQAYSLIGQDLILNTGYLECRNFTLRFACLLRDIQGLGIA